MIRVLRDGVLYVGIEANLHHVMAEANVVVEVPEPQAIKEVVMFSRPTLRDVVAMFVDNGLLPRSELDALSR